MKTLLCLTMMLFSQLAIANTDHELYRLSDRYSNELRNVRGTMVGITKCNVKDGTSYFNMPKDFKESDYTEICVGVGVTNLKLSKKLRKNLINSRRDGIYVSVFFMPSSGDIILQ